MVRQNDCNDFSRLLIPKPAPPSSSGSAIPSHPSFANAACSSCGSVSVWSCSRQYSFGKLAQILEMASLTVNCSSVNPDISISFREGDVENGQDRNEDGCRAESRGLCCLLGRAVLRRGSRLGSSRAAMGRPKYWSDEESGAGSFLCMGGQKFYNMP